MNDQVTVWVANEAGHPYEKARNLSGLENARISPLTTGDVNIMNIDRLIYHLARGIVRFAKEGDWLLVSGSPVIVAQAQLLWVLHFGKVQLLIWNGRRREYEKKVVERDNVNRILEKELF